MAETNGIYKLAGRAAILLTILGWASYFFGIFGPIRYFIFFGIAMLILAFAAYSVEEFGPRNSDA